MSVCRFDIQEMYVQFNILTDKEIAEKARALILADFTVYDSIGELAKKCNTSIFTLKRVFRKYYGASVSQFSRQQRMQEAKKLLTETNYTLQTIAEMVGYTERSNFQVAFREVTGCLPTFWRGQQNKD